MAWDTTIAADEGAAETPPAPPPPPGSPAVPELEEGRSRSEDRLKTKIPFLKFGEIEISNLVTKYFSTFGINVPSYGHIKKSMRLSNILPYFTSGNGPMGRRYPKNGVFWVPENFPPNSMHQI